MSYPRAGTCAGARRRSRVPRRGTQQGMLAIVAAILFAIAWVLNATGTVHGEDRVGGLHDVVHRILDPHLAEAQLAELVQRMAHILHRDAHLLVTTHR